MFLDRQLILSHLPKVTEGRFLVCVHDFPRLFSGGVPTPIHARPKEADTTAFHPELPLPPLGEENGFLIVLAIRAREGDLGHGEQIPVIATRTWRVHVSSRFSSHCEGLSFLQAMVEISSCLPKAAGGERLEGFLHVVHPGLSFTQANKDFDQLLTVFFYDSKEFSFHDDLVFIRTGVYLFNCVEGTATPGTGVVSQPALKETIFTSAHIFFRFSSRPRGG